jgi:tight adherence protein C
MYIVLAIVLFLTLTTAVFALGAAVFAPASVLGMRLRRLTGAPTETASTASIQDRLERALDPISKALPKSPSEVSETRAWLMQAGYREARQLTIYFGLRGFLAVAALLVVIVTGWGHGNPTLFVALPALGYILPRFVLKRMIKARQMAIRLALPDALDLTVICVEAGLGLDQSLQRVAQELKSSHPALSDELGLVHLEMRAGKPRPEALRNLALRTGVDDVRALVAVLVQTDRFGTGISQALRVHSDALRTERRQRAEEAAAKVSVKMVPVLVFFIFPAMFFVSLGPAAIAIIRVLLPVMQK